MTTDWVKMRTDLYRHPKIILIADSFFDENGPLAQSVEDRQTDSHLHVSRNVMRNATVGALVTLWGALRHRGVRDGDDVILRHSYQFTVDEMCDLPGLAKALISVEWMIQEEKQLRFPRFFASLNVDPEEDKKLKNAERQKRHREKHGVTRNVTEPSNSNAREEKRRVEKNREENLNTNIVSSISENQDEGEASKGTGDVRGTEKHAGVHIGSTTEPSGTLASPPSSEGPSSSGVPAKTSRVPNRSVSDEVAPGVFLTPEQKERILQQISSKAERRYWTQELADYARDKPVLWRKYKDHERVLMKWRRRHLENGFTWNEALGHYEKKPAWKVAEVARPAPQAWKPQHVEPPPEDSALVRESRERIANLVRSAGGMS